MSKKVAPISDKEIINEVKQIVKSVEKDTKKNNVSESDFKVVKIGSLALERSYIDDPEKLRLHLDKPSFLSLSAKALSLRLTWDEYLRRIIWSDVAR